MSNYKFSKASQKKLSECCAFIQEVAKVALRISYLDFKINCAYRGKTAQNKAYDTKASKLKFPNSKHNKKPSQAIDIVICISDRSETWQKVHYCAMYGIFKAAESLVKAEFPIFEKYNLIGGANWDNDDIIISDQTFQDLGHYEQRYI